MEAEFAILYSDQQYCSKRELIARHGFLVTERMYPFILEYRQRFARPSPVSGLHFCCLLGLVESLFTTASLLLDCERRYLKINHPDLAGAEQAWRLTSLNQAAQDLGLFEVSPLVNSTLNKTLLTYHQAGACPLEEEKMMELWRLFDCSSACGWRTSSISGPAPTEIESLMAALEDYAKEQDSFIATLLIHASLVYISPFEHSNLLIADLVLRDRLADYPLARLLPPLLVAEKEIEQLRATCQAEGDLTYLISFFNHKLYNGLVEISTWLTKLAAGSLDQELPITTRQVQELVLQEPALASYQAEFYLAHSQSGQHYTISHFQQACGVCYETARVRMDQLVALGYYHKKAVGNKFVYVSTKG